MGQIFRQILPDAPALPDSVLAPMSGITDRPFRRAVRRAGGGLVVSEMIASKAMVKEPAHKLRVGIPDIAYDGLLNRAPIRRPEQSAGIETTW